jgi:hypothetical protein
VDRRRADDHLPSWPACRAATERLIEADADPPPAILPPARKVERVNPRT